MHIASAVGGKKTHVCCGGKKIHVKGLWAGCRQGVGKVKGIGRPCHHLAKSMGSVGEGGGGAQRKRKQKQSFNSLR